MANVEQTLVQCLEKTLDNIGYEEREIEVKPFNSGASNFTTVLFGVTVTSFGKETLYLFGKVGNIGEKLRKQMKLDGIFATEYRFYTQLVPAFQEFYNKCNVPDEDRLYFTKFYGGSLEKGVEVVILEHLNKYTLFDRKKPIDWEHAAVSIKNLAKFHALGFAVKIEKPEMFEEFTNVYNMQLTMHNMAINNDTTMVELMKIVPDEYKPKVNAIFADKDFITIMNSGTLGSGYNTLIHSDYRTSNLMYKRQNDKIISVPVDFQTLRIGNVFEDILYFILLSTDEQFRKYYWKQLIEYYYTELTNSLRQLKLNVKEIYPKESFDDDLKTFLPTSVIIVLMTLPVVLADTSAAPDMSSNDATFEALITPSNEISQERINGVMRDFARMGVF